MKRFWVFYVDGFKGKAERYDTGKYDIFVTWRNLGCHLNGLKPSFTEIVLQAEKEA